MSKSSSITETSSTLGEDEKPSKYDANGWGQVIENKWYNCMINEHVDECPYGDQLSTENPFMATL